jgi:UDP-N-acetylmuramoyl-tripeptide--D-alanyl-D-alanine ligase
MNTQELYEIYISCSSVTTDTRKPVRDSLFFALHGENFNGNQFAAEALENGAAYAVIDDKKMFAGNRFILVDDTLHALQDLAACHRPKLRSGIIAITGSNGKTTTKELISRILAQKYRVFSTPGNLNNHIGVPLTILSIRQEHQIGVVELGASHTGEIMKLCRIAQPAYGLVTNIGRAHLEGFGSLNGVIKAKGELYEYLNETHGCTFINCENSMLTDMLKKFSGVIIKYGNCAGSLCSGKILETNPFLSLLMTYGKEHRHQLPVKTRLVGDYNLENILAAAAVGHYFSVDPEKIVKAIEAYVPEILRSQMERTKFNRVIIDAYNANPSSMEAALKNFCLHPDKNKVLILGEMKELGDSSAEEHENLISLIQMMGFNHVYLVGEAFKGIDIPAEWQWFRNVEELIGKFKNNPVQDATVLLKGSRAVELEKLLPFL